MSGNTFNLDAFNDAMFVACHDERATEIADQGFSLLHETTQRHLRYEDMDFGRTTKGEVLGFMIDDLSNQITNPERYKNAEINLQNSALAK
jgi:hypothetical protein